MGLSIELPRLPLLPEDWQLAADLATELAGAVDTFERPGPTGPTIELVPRDPNNPNAEPLVIICRVRNGHKGPVVGSAVVVPFFAPILQESLRAHGYKPLADEPFDRSIPAMFIKE